MIYKFVGRWQKNLEPQARKFQELFVRDSDWSGKKTQNSNNANRTKVGNTMFTNFQMGLVFCQGLEQRSSVLLSGMEYGYSLKICL